MTRPALIHTPDRVSIVGKRVLLAAIALLVALIALYALALRPRGSTLETTPLVSNARVLQAMSVAGGRSVALTMDNRLILLQDNQVAAEKAAGAPLSVIAVSPDGARIAGGTSDNQIIVWNADLAEVARFPVGGRVTDLRIDPAGQILAGYGIGQYTGRFWVGRYDASGQSLLKKLVGADVNAVESGDQAIFYAPVNGKLLALDLRGNRKWEIALSGAGLIIARTAAGNLLTGDERGGVFLVSPAGKVLWSQHLSEYKIRLVAESKAGSHIVVSDDDARLYLLDGATGKTLFQSASPGGPARGLVASDENHLALVTGNGSWLTVDLTAALGSQRQQTVDTAVLIAGALLAAAAAASLVASVPRLRVPALRIGRKIRDSRKAYLMLLPAFSLILVFNYIPTAMGLYYSFTNFNLSEPIKFIGLNNFVRLSKDSFFWDGIGNMIAILVTSVAKDLIMPLMVAELVFWLRNARLKYVARTAFIIPSIVPGVVGIMLWKTIYNPQNGMLNQLLLAIGQGHLQHPWLGDEATALLSIIFAGFPWISTFAFLIYMGGLLNINRELFDSAAIDGATAWSRFWAVDLPLIGPQLQLILFFAFLGSVQGYASVWIFTQGGPGSSTYVPGLQMFLQTARGEYGYAAAIGLVLAVIVLAVTVARFRFGRTADGA